MGKDTPDVRVRRKPKDRRARARGIRMLLLDVDGVLTDGKLYLDDLGHQTRAFSVQDGQGIVLLRKAGLRVGFISGCASEAIACRAKQLGVDEVHQGVADKLAVYQDILSRYGLSDREVAYMGDDIIDRPILLRVGLSISVPNAMPSVRRLAHWVTRRRGGEGAVREVADFLLQAQGKYPDDPGHPPVL